LAEQMAIDMYIDGYARRDLSSVTGQATLSVSQDGIEIQSEELAMRVSWRSIVPMRLGTYLAFASRGVFVALVPQRAFASPNNAEAFSNKVLAMYEATRIPEERIMRLFAHNDILCHKCSYNLRGIREPTCPECGSSVEITLAREW
jgi:hypothetical protein